MDPSSVRSVRMAPRTEPPPPAPAWLPPPRPTPETEIFYPYDELAGDRRPGHAEYDEPDATRYDLPADDPRYDDVERTSVLPDVERTSVLPEGEAPPVFVDVSGRRARLAKRLGILVGGALTAYLVVIGVNLAMDADVPLAPWPAGTGETASPSPGDRPGTREPSPDTAGRGSGDGTDSRSTASPTAGTTSAERSPAPTPSAVRTSQRGKAPGTPPGQTRKPKTNE
jgi:hypothetical protein